MESRDIFVQNILKSAFHLVWFSYAHFLWTCKDPLHSKKRYFVCDSICPWSRSQMPLVYSFLQGSSEGPRIHFWTSTLRSSVLELPSLSVALPFFLLLFALCNSFRSSTASLTSPCGSQSSAPRIAAPCTSSSANSQSRCCGSISNPAHC